ncbi:MAG: acyltransferase family protein [Acidimicrobiales bacterium]
MSTHTISGRAGGTGSPSSLTDLAGAAKADRNWAIDGYRAVAMLAVAVGHWLAADLRIGTDGQLVAGNALSDAPHLGWITWLLQVMPLFFVVGGYASAASLDAHRRTGGRDNDWVSARLRRLYAPVALLAAVWLAIIVVTGLLGVGALGVAAAGAAAIPLWFIANYTIDTAIAPKTLPRFRRNPGRFVGTLVGVFAALELLRFLAVPVLSSVLPQANWVIGWLLFQVAGFAWRDGLIVPGRRLVTVAVAALAGALALVTVGPYPVSMVHFPGIGSLSPTYPPSLALMLFGIGYSGLAIAAAPAVNRLFDRRPGLWTATVAANAVAMSVYLWHFTAAAAAGAVMYATGTLPTAAVGTGAWWLQKVPFLALATIVLVGLVSRVARVEQGALLAPRTATTFSYPALLGMAGVLSLAVKLGWTSHTPGGIVAGCTVVLVGYLVVLHRPDRKIGATLRG